MAAAAEALREAMEHKAVMDQAEEKLNLAKAAVVLHLHHISGVSMRGKAISEISMECEDLIKLLGKFMKEDEKYKAVKSFHGKTSALISNIAYASDALHRWNDDSIDIFRGFTEAYAVYCLLSDQFRELESGLRMFGAIPTQTPEEAAFVQKHLQ